MATLPVERKTPRFDRHVALRLRQLRRGGRAQEETVLAESIGLGGARLLTTLDLAPGEICRLDELHGPFWIAARVQSVTVADGWRRTHVAFLSSGSTLRRWLTRLGVLPPPGEVTVDAPTIGEHERHAITAAVEDAFVGVPGDWRVVIAPVRSFAPAWWLVTVVGGQDLFVFSLMSSEQAPPLVAQRLRERLRQRRLVD